MDYEHGKAYRENLRERPRNSSHKDPKEAYGECPVTRHSTTAHHHKETVGHMGGAFHHPTQPNSEAMAHGNSGSSETTRRFRRTDLNTVKLKPTS